MSKEVRIIESIAIHQRGIPKVGRKQAATDYVAALHFLCIFLVGASCLIIPHFQTLFICFD